MNKLTKDDFVRILTEPKNAILKQYKELCFQSVQTGTVGMSSPDPAGIIRRKTVE